MINYNLHQHSIFSDGNEAPEKYVEQAIKESFSAMGFSEHSPLPFPNPFSLKEEQVEEYIKQTDLLKDKSQDKLSIYRALEMDYIPGMSEDFDYWQKRCKTDYLIGSVHLVKPPETDELWFTDGPDYKIYDQGIEQFFEGDIRKAVKAFFNQTNLMIASQEFDIIGHFDKIKMHNKNRYFTEEEKWYRDLIDETVELIKEKGLIVEINTRGLYKKRSDSLFPDGYALERVKELNIPVIISSDAHQPDELNRLFSETSQKIKRMGFRELMYFNQGIWDTIPIS